VVDRGQAPAPGIVLLEPRQPQVEHRRLQAVEAAVGADLDVVVARGLAMVGEPEDLPHQVGVHAGDAAGVAEGAEVLGRVEAPGRQIAERADAPPLVLRAVRLRRVLDQPEAARAAEGADRVGVERPAVEVDADDAARARRRAPLELGRVEVESRRVDVAEDRRRAHQDHRLGGREEAEGGHQHLVAGAGAERAQRDHQRVRAVADTDHRGGAEEVGEGLLELLDLGAENEGVGVGDRPPAHEQLGFDGMAGTGEIEIGNLGQGVLLVDVSASGCKSAASGRKGAASGRKG
jgi:hypothetical protein